MKLPVKPLRNFDERGPLYWLLYVAHEFQTERDWMPDDFESEEQFPRMQVRTNIFVALVSSHTFNAKGIGQALIVS
jgi:hypothetical protein